MYIYLKYESNGDVPDIYLAGEAALAKDKLQYLETAEEAITTSIFIDRLDFTLEKTRIIEINKFLDEHPDYTNSTVRTMRQEVDKLISHHNLLIKRIWELEDIQKNKDKLLDWYCDNYGICYIKQEVQE